MVANVTVVPTAAPSVRCAPGTAMVASDVAFDLTAAGSSGFLSFPFVFNFSNARGAESLFYPRGRALYLCLNGEFVRSTDASLCRSSFLALWGIDVAFRDTVPDAYTFLSSYTCHNTEFSVLEAKCTGTSADTFVRACHDCISQHFGCKCHATEVDGAGHARDPASLALAVFGSAFSLAAVWLFPYLGRAPSTDQQPLLGGEERAWRDVRRVLFVFFSVVSAALLSVLVYLSPGDAYTPQLDHAAFTGLAAALAIGTAASAVCVALLPGVRYVLLCVAFEWAQLMQWSAPTFFSAPSTGWLTYLLLALLLSVALAQHAVGIKGAPACGAQPYVILGTIACVFRGWLLARVPCE